MEFAEFLELGRRLAQRIEDGEGQGEFAEVGIEFIDLAQHPLILEGVGHRFAAAVDKFGRAHRGHVEGEIGHHWEHDPAVDASVPALGHQLRQILRIGMVAVEVKKQINPEVIMAVDEHRVGWDGERRTAQGGISGGPG